MILKAALAMASNRVIGQKGDLPWRLPEDLKLFKKTTLGHPIIMGRKTFDSIGRPLPKRRNIVLSKSMEPQDNVEVIRSPEELDALGIQGDAYIIGGAGIFALFLPKIEEIYLSYVFEAHEGDTFCPPFEDAFKHVDTLATFPEFEYRHYVRVKTQPSAASTGTCS